MAQRPNPTQTRRLDAVTLRREMKSLLSANVILDREEELEILDLSNQNGRANALRVALLRAILFGDSRPATLAPTDRDELEKYILGKGPRPVWARLASPDGHFGMAFLSPDDPAAHVDVSYGPPEDPDEPRRYVEPRGRFALPGSPFWAPDTR